MVVHDVTDVRRSEEAARRGMYEAAARLRSVIDATPLGVVMLSDELEVRLANPAAGLLLAGRPAVIVGRALGSLLDAELAERLATPLLHGEHVSGVEVEHARGDGSHVALRISGAPLRLPEGHLRGAVLIIEDATERRLVDETLRLAQKLEVLATVAGGVAHDFNNLLTVILGHSQRALAKLPVGEPARSHLEKALPAVEQAVGVARQLLVYAGGSRPVVGPLDVGRLVREERAMLAATVPAHVTLEIAQPDELPCVEASADEVRQALTALLANAVEAIGGRRGKVTLALASRRIEAGEAAYSRHTGQPLAGGEYVCVAVEDDGAGMRPEILPRIFDPFFTTKFVGRGLGLAAVLGIVRSHRGGISVSSAPGKGSRFEIALPVESRPAAEGKDGEPAQEKLPTRERVADAGATLASS
jgi:PAS domain S-box-containing protein